MNKEKQKFRDMIKFARKMEIQPGKNYFIILDTESPEELRLLQQELQIIMQEMDFGGCHFFLGSKKILEILEFTNQVIPSWELETLLKTIRSEMGAD